MLTSRRALALGLAGLALAGLLLPADGAQGPKQLEPTQKWTGSVEDLDLLKAAPKEGYLATAKDFAQLWKAWNVGEKLPEVDFQKSLVVLATSRGSKLRILARLDDKGALSVGGLGTRDLRPGFRYEIAVVSRDGVKTVNGKNLPPADGK